MVHRSPHDPGRRRAVPIDPRCVECFVRQGNDLSILLPDGQAREALLADIHRWARELDRTGSTASVGQDIHRRLRHLTGDADPYRAAKRVFNNLLLDLLPELRHMIRGAPDRLLLTTRLAIAANIIDFGPNGSLTPLDVLRELRGVLDEPFHADWQPYLAALATARRILYLTDNAGEIVVDQLLIQAIGPRRVTVAVRGAPVVNDATVDDARYTGLARLVTVIDNGSDAPGTLLDDCTPEFRHQVDSADMINAKGQGNVESLSNADLPAFFLFKVKCAVVAQQTGLPTGTHALLSGRRRRQHLAPPPIRHPPI